MNTAMLGKYGETIAARYLRFHGYDILSANYQTRFGEIDLIAEDRKYVTFVEVKTRTKGMISAPADAVDLAKRERIIATAQFFLQNYKIKRQPRFDIIEVYFDGERPEKLNFIENAFDAEGK